VRFELHIRLCCSLYTSCLCSPRQTGVRSSSSAIMDALADYHGSSSEEEEDDVPKQSTASSSQVKANAAPSIASMQAQILQRTLDICPVTPDTYSAINPSNALVLKHGQKELKHNPKFADLSKPLQGPDREHGAKLNDFKSNTRTGHVQKYQVDNIAFMDQFDNFNHFGVATDVSGNLISNNGVENGSGGNGGGGASQSNKKRKRAKNRGVQYEDDGSGGPWAKVAARDEVQVDRRTDLEKGTLTAEQEEFRKEYVDTDLVAKEETQEDRDREEAFKFTKGEGPAVPWTKGLAPDECKSIFHGAQEVDYQGRSWMTPPAGHRESDPNHKCFIPNKCVHTYTGHTKGVNCIKFLPGAANLLLSCSMDKKIKIWDVYNQRRCM